MKITKKQLEKLIKEAVLEEVNPYDTAESPAGQAAGDIYTALESFLSGESTATNAFRSLHRHGHFKKSILREIAEETKADMIAVYAELKRLAQEEEELKRNQSPSRILFKSAMRKIAKRGGYE